MLTSLLVTTAAQLVTALEALTVTSYLLPNR